MIPDGHDIAGYMQATPCGLAKGRVLPLILLLLDRPDTLYVSPPYLRGWGNPQSP